MNENNFISNNEKNTETVSGNTAPAVGVSGHVTDDIRTGGSSASGSDGAETFRTVSDGNGSSGMHSVSMGDAGSSLYSSGTGTLAGVDYTPDIQAVMSEIAAINKTVGLLFFFLLLTWAEKKISVVVNRFTTERKK